MYEKFNKNPGVFQEIDKNDKNRPNGWVTKQKKQDDTGSWKVVNTKVSMKRNNIRDKLLINSNNNLNNHCTLLTSQVEAPASITQQIERSQKEKVNIVVCKLKLHRNGIKNSKTWKKRLDYKTQWRY